MTSSERATIFYVATGNAGKLRDFAIAAERFAIDGGEGCTLLPLPGLEAIAAPAEGAITFEGNAREKAIYYSGHAGGEVVIADDSGLEVDALCGAPGVYSARYAERAGVLDGPLDAANNRHLLAEMARALGPAGMVENLAHRWARYRCVLAAARDGVCLATAEGSVEGVIIPAPRGEGGFGYDPLFYLPALERTMAELDAAVRLDLSHRGAALRALLPKLAALVAAHR
jgi:XTP/dITP diphosphohydrolase